MHKTLHTRVHNRLSLGHRRLPVGLGVLDHTGEIVHGIEVNVFEGFHFGFNVPRHSQIHHQHGAVLAFFKRPIYSTQSDDGQGAGRTTDDSIEFVEALREFAQVHHFAAKTAGKFFPAF